MPSDARWAAARDEHRAALEAYAAAVRALPAGGWTRPWSGEGKWTPAEITEHLALTYRAFLQELTGGEAMRMKVRGVKLRLLRWLLLPHMLFHRTFPKGAVAPREVRPAGRDLGPDDALADLRDVVERAEAAIESARGRAGAVVTHPYFGGIEVVRAWRFATVHLEHHLRQVRSAAG